MNLPDPAPVTDLIEAFRRSKTMFAAVSLGIFDRLHSEPANAAALARAIGADADALERLLDGCAALGLVEKSGGVYRNSAVADTYLVRSGARSLTGYILYSDEALYPMWAHLEDAVREGTSRWAQTFDLKGPIFDHFFRTESAMREFLLGMHGHGLLSSPAVAAAFDLSGFGRLVDLGGATGHLAIAACERYPELRGVVFDLDRAVPLAREMVARSPAASRIDVMAGDFFSDELPQADLYAVGQILHDWTEEKIHALLARIYRSLPPGGGLLIAEKLLAEDGVGPPAANMQSLNMLIATEGKERRLSEYTRLLRQSGFGTVEGRRTGTRLDAILARKTVE